MIRSRTLISLLGGLMLSFTAHAGKLALVIDDFGYRPAEENQILQMSPQISVSVLPDAPHSHEMAVKAHQLGHEVIIHLPMAPLSKQPLEKNTLTPDMSSAEVARIIQEAVNKVPFAVGLNNHQGSKMTSSLSGMQKVMQALDHYNLYFLDSMTIAGSQSIPAAQGTHVRILKRRVFLDDSQNEADIRQQFQRAVKLAQRDGYAIAIGHPHPTTVRVLRAMLPNLPADVTLVRPSQLLNEPQRGTTASASTHPTSPGKPQSARFKAPGLCVTRQPIAPVPATRMLSVIAESIAQSPLYKKLADLF